MTELFTYIYGQPLRRIVLIIFFLILLWAWLKKRFGSSYVWRILNIILFAISLIVIIYYTLYSRNERVSDLVFVPLKSFQEAKNQPELYRSMLMNVFLFVPLGLSMSNVAGMVGAVKVSDDSSNKQKRTVISVLSILCGICLSVGIEYCQYRYSLGRCEVDDVIMNTIGCAIGVMSYIIRFPKMDKWSR